MSLLLDIILCASLDPSFKHRFLMENEPVVMKMDEVKAYGDQNEDLQAGKRLLQDFSTKTYHSINSWITETFVDGQTAYIHSGK